MIGRMPDAIHAGKLGPANQCNSPLGRGANPGPTSPSPDKTRQILTAFERLPFIRGSLRSVPYQPGAATNWRSAAHYSLTRKLTPLPNLCPLTTSLSIKP